MISPDDLLASGQALLFKQPAPNEADIRAAISGFYYALFHRLSQAGARMFAAGGHPLEAQVARAYNHGPMRKVCEAYSRRRALPALLNGLVIAAPSNELLFICDRFALLQQARHVADYDLHATVTLKEGLERWADCRFSLAAFQTIEGSSEVTVFLAALLLDTQWTRRG